MNHYDKDSRSTLSQFETMKLPPVGGKVPQPPAVNSASADTFLDWTHDHFASSSQHTTHYQQRITVHPEPRTSSLQYPGQQREMDFLPRAEETERRGGVIRSPSPVMEKVKKDRVECLHEYFELTCAWRSTDAAVICDSSRLTYLELEQRSNRLAHVLLAHGLVTGRPIGILLERSFDTYITLLGVLKAGAAFVPLDPSSPTDRVAYIVEDAGLWGVVTTSAFRGKTGLLPCFVLELDQVRNELQVQSENPPHVPVDPASLCYVIYTSGTTGRPKGVAVSHASIVNFLRVVIAIYGVMPDDRVYQGMSSTFDFSFEEIWPTWIAGATLIAGPTDSRRLGHGLAEFLIAHQVTVLYCVPTLLATIDCDVPTVRALMVGGEACPADLVRRWSRPGRRILNTYGPTETTVTATWCELLPDRPVTIGVPLPTYRAYIFDDHLRPVAPGENGELCIGGPGVAIGYLNRPELTESRFVSNPIWYECDVAPRLYRTGDLARFTLGGEIEYLGRIDTQLKIRGYRVELGEIEQILREEQAVENAVVRPLETNGVAQDLVGYLTLRVPSTEDGIAALRGRLHSALSRRLPSYMVPAFIEVLDAFPLLAADKVNRAALPEPVRPRLGSNDLPPVAATTALENYLAVIWGQVLGRARVSVEDDFFTNLGGHSLAAAQIISQLRRDPRLQGLSVGDLYSHSTIRALAYFIEAPYVASTATSQQAKAPRPEVRKHSNLRVLSCGVMQMITLYALVFIVILPIIGLHRATGSYATLIILGVVEAIWSGLISFLLPVVGSRLLLAGVRPGLYPLWGLTYLRWWVARRMMAFAPLGMLAGTPLLPPYLRLLGARVGRHCHIASAKIAVPKLVEIGRDVSIGYGVQVQPFEVRDGWLSLAPIYIDDGAFIGTNSVVLAGARIGSNAFIAEQTLVAQDQVIPPHEHWRGSPSKQEKAPPPLLRFMAARANSRPWPVSVLMGFIAGLFLLVLLALFTVMPSAALILVVTLRAGLLWGCVSTLLAGPLFVLAVCVIVFIGKRAVMPRTLPGIYSIRGGFGVRKWLNDQLMSMSLSLTNTLYATLYLIPFLRRLGARIGRWAEVSTVGDLDPNLLTIGNESFVADIAVLAPAVFHFGCVALAPVMIGDRSFVGNGALIPIATQIGEHCLIGVHSLPPTSQVKPGTSWLGSPAIFLPRRQESQHFENDLIYRPRTSLLAWRLFIEFFRVILPGALLMFTSLLVLYAMFLLGQMVSPLALLCIVPLLIQGGGLVATLIVALLKWVIVGRYRPRVEPLWSVFVRRSELITALYEAVAVPSLVGLLTGTPWIAPILRLFGARIGRRVWLDTTFLTEFDLVQVGDDAAVGDTTSLQTHLFEDRVMKMSTVKIGDASSVGSRSVVLYDAEVGAGASLDSLSLAMKGETLPPDSRWRGIPARAS